MKKFSEFQKEFYFENMFNCGILYYYKALARFSYLLYKNKWIPWLND